MSHKLRRLVPYFAVLCTILPITFFGILNALPSQKGDLDEDNKLTIRDVVRVVNHIQQREYIFTPILSHLRTSIPTTISMATMLTS